MKTLVEPDLRQFVVGDGEDANEDVVDVDVGGDDGVDDDVGWTKKHSGRA
jgi:hypothetical protein